MEYHTEILPKLIECVNRDHDRRRKRVETRELTTVYKVKKAMMMVVLYSCLLTCILPYCIVSCRREANDVEKEKNRKKKPDFILPTRFPLFFFSHEKNIIMMTTR